MANTTVTSVSDLLLTNVTAGVKAGDQKVSDTSGFSEVMNIAKDSTSKVGAVKGDDVAKTRTVVETPKSKEIRTEDKAVRDPMANKADKAEFTEEVAKEASKIYDKIKEVLNVSDEDIENAMETLGITAVDLLDPVSIRELCMELTGVADSISLITNAQLYVNVKEIAQAADDAVAQIAAQFGMTTENTESIFKDESIIDAVKETFSDLINKSEAAELQSQEATVLTDGNQVQMPITDTDVTTKAGDTATAENHIDTVVKADADTNANAAAGTEAKAVTVEVKGTPNERPVQESVRPEEAREVGTEDPLAKSTVGTTETFKAATKPEESSLKENSSEAEVLKGNNETQSNVSRFADIDTAAAAPQQTTVVNTEVNDLGQVVETVTTYSNGQAESIMSQVTESIRVSYTPDTTSMEMQLHPASLGTVNMNIASTNGVVTAHILVESEAVKAALESQLITLQQTFDEQGMKVEAVEVAVANYDLNRGTGSETGSNSEDHNQGRAGRVGTRRRINLNDLSDDDMEELSEEEKLSADMMARSGNSVDYTA